MHEYERALPIVGERLVKLRFCGNGKDSEATIEIEGGRKIEVPLDDAAMDISFSGATIVRTRGWGDTEVVIEIVPVADQPVTIEEASVHFPGSDDEWNECIRDYADMGRWTLHWCVSLRLRLIAMGSQ
jgi:hypothetical protein